MNNATETSCFAKADEEALPYDLAFHIGGIFIIFLVSFFGTVIPIYCNRMFTASFF
jgi:hypothetical protein